MTTETPATELRARITRALDECRSMISAAQADVVLSVLRKATQPEIKAAVLGTTEQADTVAAPTADRATVLREAGDAIVAENDRQMWASSPGQHWAADLLYRLAAEAQQPEPEVAGCKRCGCSPRCCACDFAEAQQPTPAPAEEDGCWCGHPQDRHFTSQSMTLPNGCHDCQGWNGAHAYGQDLPWAATPAPAEETKSEARVCGDRSPATGLFTCQRSPGHTYPHRNAKQKGTETSSWWGRDEE